MKLKLLVSAVALALATDLSAQKYVVVDLGTLGASYYNSSAQSINAYGQITGYSFNYVGGSGDPHAFYYSNGIMRDIGIPGGSSYGINNNGQMAGYVFNDQNSYSAFLYSTGVVQYLGTLGYYSSLAYGINNNGQVVGMLYSCLPGRNPTIWHAFLYSNGSVEDLGTLAGGGSIAYGINDSGQVVGADYYSPDFGGPRYAFLYSNGSMRDLVVFSMGNSSQANGINASGQIVGWAYDTNYSQHAFLYSSGVVQDLGTLSINNNSPSSSANGINTAGQVVGTSFTGSAQHAFLYSGGVMKDLNNLVISTNSGWVLEQANAINDSGQIVGYESNQSGQTHPFLLNPVSLTAPIIITQPQSQTAQAGSNVAFSVVANGWPSPNYQWQFKGQNLAGQAAASLSLSNVQFSNAGGYLVIATNTYGSVTSSVAELKVFTNLVVVQTNRTPTTNEIGQPTIPTDTNHFKVYYTNGTFKSGIALNPNKMTVVLTHGWNGSPSDWAAYTARIIQQRIGVNAVNIVAWDWSAEAQSAWYELGAIAAKTPGEGRALGTDLIAAVGSNYSQRIHFIGHSLGALVNAAAANYVHAHGYSWTNTQMTLCDEAEVAWAFTSAGWQMATTIPEIVQQGVSTLLTFDGNFSTPQPGWAHPLPNQFAWADNYVSAFGLLHSNAANVILTYTYPSSLPDVNTVVQEFYNFHDYAHFFYEDTIEPGLFNSGGQTNATYAGFVCSFEGGGFAGRPGTNTYFYQDPGGLELNLVQKDLAFATNFLNARFEIYQLIGITTLASQGENGVFGAVAQAVGQVNGQIASTGQNLEDMVLNLFTTVSGGSRIGNRGAHPSGGPVPKGGGSGNTPAYAWVPVNVPSNALWMSFDYMLQGNGNNDSFQVALDGTNILSLETSLIQTNVALNSGMIDVSQYAGEQVTLFMGIVGGTSTNAALTASDFQFYAALPPSLQIQLAGTNVVVSWPLWAAGYVLQTTDKLRTTNSWAAVTNVPVIVNFQYTVTNQISGGSLFYRLAKTSTVAPGLQAHVSGSSIVFSWAASAQNFSLQTTTNLTEAGSWAAVTNIPAILNQQNVVTDAMSGAKRFYRLKMQ